MQMTTTDSNQSAARIDYGLDGPPIVRNFFLIGSGFVLAGMIAYFLLAAAAPGLALSGLIIGLMAGLPALLSAVIMVRSSQLGKLKQGERLMDLVNLRGDEHVLDVGCGRGLLMIAAAKRLPRGQAVGIDLWQAEDLSGNSAAAALANAATEGVAERVEVKTGDMRQMPFPDAAFDVAVASMAIHNLPSADGRAQAIREIARVLKPGGRVALQDFLATGEYARTLTELGWQKVERSGLNFALWPPVRIVTATKP
jgi:arsenite methyltransferase